MDGLKFQSTLPRRERRKVTSIKFIIEEFQSTLPRRERPVLSIYLLVYLLHFNPHSHEGSDEYNTLRQTTNRRYFNPHSHEGSDVWLSSYFSQKPKFQSTLPRRERPFFAVLLDTSSAISIHTPTKGATLWI